MKKNIFKIIIITLILVFNMLNVFAEESNFEEYQLTSVKGKVIEIITEMSKEELGLDENSFITEKQIVRVLVRQGKYKGKEYIIENSISDNFYYDVRVKEGDNVLLVVDEVPGQGPNFYISSHVRDSYIYIILGIFALLLVLVGGIKGIKSIVTLCVTMAVIGVFMMPQILNGHSPILLSIISSIVITMFTLFIISGFNRKSYATILGTAAGVIVAGVLAYIIGILAKLTGLNSTEANMLLYIPQKINFDFKGLLFAGIIIGTLGAVMDISMSISSSMNEIKLHNPDISSKELIKSGLNVGKDVMGTMTNTLILAYTGTSIPLLLIFMAYKTPVIEILNLDIIATEIIRAVTGSIGIVLTIPFTTLIAGYLMRKTSN